MQVGSIIKSFDFAGNTDCYVVGIVTGVDNDYIEFNTIKVVWDGKVDGEIQEAQKKMRTVKQGLMFGDATFQRVVTLD